MHIVCIVTVYTVYKMTYCYNMLGLKLYFIVLLLVL